MTFLRSNPAARPYVLVVYRQGRPDAILVGRIAQGEIGCRLGYLEMGLGARIMYFVYGALRGSPSGGNCELLVDEVVRSLSQGEADVAWLNFLRPGSEFFLLAMNRPGRLSRDYIRVSQMHFAATLPVTVDELYRTLPRGVRGFNKTKHHKLLRDFAGRVEVKCFRAVAEIDAMVRDVEQVARTSYQRGLGVGFIDSPKMREGLRRKAEKGWLRAYILYLAERPCAFWIGDMYQGTFSGDYVGYDPKFGKYSPGMFLFTKVIEAFCDGHREGVTRVDYGPGYARYKEILANQRWRETSVYMFAPSIKGISLNLARSFVVGIDQAIKKTLAHTSLLQRIKKRWRVRLTPKEATQS